MAPSLCTAAERAPNHTIAMLPRVPGRARAHHAVRTLRGPPVEIVSGLHQLRTPMNTPGLPYVMPYLFEGPDGVALFDAGYGTKEVTSLRTFGCWSSRMRTRTTWAWPHG
jgi:hypothetical protein